jgi:hypothetical protein
MARDAYLHFIWSEQNFENPFTYTEKGYTEHTKVEHKNEILVLWSKLNIFIV